jgi:hypothetical protein
MSHVLDPNESYTFSKIFELKIPADELAEEFGYGYRRSKLDLPKYVGTLDRLDETRSRIEEILPYVDLANETSRRELLISRVVTEVIHYTKAQLRIEYPIKVTNHLQGYLDYLMRSKTDLLVIEVKRQDLDYGMTQLIAQLIALDQWDKTPNQPKLLGAVTTGKVWEFALLDRAGKRFEQDLESYRFPTDLDPLMRMLVQALMS